MSSPSNACVIRFVALAVIRTGDSDEVPEGAYLAAFDPEAFEGRGHAAWTTDLALAQRFEDAAEALTFWKTVPKCRPLRPDGKPNRPLTAFTITVQRLEPTNGASSN